MPTTGAPLVAPSMQFVVVSLRAMSLPAVDNWHSPTAADVSALDILLMRYRFKVIRVHATAVLTEMV